MDPKRNKSNRPRSKADFYQTPFELADATIDRLILSQNINLLSVQNVLDPGCGNGVWTDAYIAHIKNTSLTPEFYGIDINDHPLYNKFIYTDLVLADYLEHDYGEMKFDLVIGNPPFSLMEEFVRKSYDLLSDKGVIAFLGRLEFLGSQKRAKGLFLELCPSEIWVSSRRPSFFSVLEGKHTTDMMEYAIFIWRKDRSVEWGALTSLDWLLWEYNK